MCRPLQTVYARTTLNGARLSPPPSRSGLVSSDPLKVTAPALAPDLEPCSSPSRSFLLHQCYRSRTPSRPSHPVTVSLTASRLSTALRQRRDHRVQHRARLYELVIFGRGEGAVLMDDFGWMKDRSQVVEFEWTRFASVGRRCSKSASRMRCTS